MSRGGARRGAGRPEGTTDPSAARVALQVRCREEQRATWRLAAELAGVDLSEQVREMLDGWARRTISKHEVEPAE